MRKYIFVALALMIVVITASHANPLVYEGPIITLSDLNSQNHKQIGGYIDSEKVTIIAGQNGVSVSGRYFCHLKKMRPDFIDILIPVPVFEGDLDGKVAPSKSEIPSLSMNGLPLDATPVVNPYNTLKVKDGNSIYFRMFQFRHAAAKIKRDFVLDVKYDQKLVKYQGDSSIIYVPFIPRYFGKHNIFKYTKGKYNLVFINDSKDSTSEYFHSQCAEVPTESECSVLLTNKKPFVMRVRKKNNRG